MIRSIVDSVGMMYSRVYALASVPKTVKDRMFIQFGIDEFHGSVITTNEDLGVTLIVSYDDIPSYKNEIVLFDTFPIASKDSSMMTRTHRYIIIPDMFKGDHSRFDDTVGITYSIVLYLLKMIDYSNGNMYDKLSDMALALTMYIFDKYKVSEYNSDVPEVLTTYEYKDDEIADIVEAVMIDDIIGVIVAGINPLSDINIEIDRGVPWIIARV